MTDTLIDTTQQFWDFPAEHAYRHKLRPDGREALAHMLVFPEHSLAGFIYPSVRAGGEGKARATFIGPAIGEKVEETFEEQVSDDVDFSDWRIGPLHMAIRDPHRTVDLAWRGERIQFEGRYEALFPPYAFSSHPRGVPPYYGDDRTEQHGSVVGDLTIDGKSWHLDGFLIRDHSWGPRVWGLNQHYKWFHAVTGDSSIHFFEMQSFGKRQLSGYVFKNGEMRHLVEADYDYTFDDQMMQTSFDVVVTDIDGRSAEVKCKTFAMTQLDYDPMVYLNEAATSLTIDGKPGVGWCEFCWNKNYWDFAKQHVVKYG